MQNDIVRQPPQNQEEQTGVVEPPAPPESPQATEEPLSEAVAPEEQVAEALQPTQSSTAPVGVIILALIICVALCAAVIYGTLQAQN